MNQLIPILATLSDWDAAMQARFGSEGWGTALRVAALAGIGIPAALLLSRIVWKVSEKRLGPHFGMLLKKLSLFAGLSGIGLSVLLELGFNLSAMLGAAGVASVAIGFASQTSLSNIISGLFLYWEKPFAVGEVVKVGETTGVVLSIDLLSVKLRQFDNQFVRIPNETMIKAQVTTVNKFPIRRVDIEVSVALGTDIDRTIAALKRAAEHNPLCLDDPEPVVIFRSFGPQSLGFTLGAWAVSNQFLDTKNTLMRDIQKQFAEEGIEIPLPQIVVRKPEEIR